MVKRIVLFTCALLVVAYSTTMGAPERQTRRRARELVRSHVEPRDCFIWYVNNEVGWAPIGAVRHGARGDTGCAHWVAHQFGIKRGSVKCKKGYAVRVADIIRGKRRYPMAKARVGDLWEDPTSHSHIGIVRDIRRNSSDRVVSALVEHDSSEDERGVVREWFRRGDFYRWRRRSTKRQSKREAIRLVRKHVVPRDCFIWYVNNEVGWAPIGAVKRKERGGNGCAHWVAHQLRIKRGSVKCAKRYSIRIADIVKYKKKYDLSRAQVGDIWKTASNSDVGIVRELKRADSGSVTAALVEHDDATRERGVVEKWVTSGQFYR